jgi:ketosteroid isomerase-like protein
MSHESPDVELLESLLAAFNRHDVEDVMAFFTEDCVFEMPRGPDPWGRRLEGKAEVREGIEARFAGIPDIHYGKDRHWVCGDRGVSSLSRRTAASSTAAALDAQP